MSWFRNQEGSSDFDVSSVQVNHNMMSKPHRDLANSGLSGIVTAGHFTGGEVLYWPLDVGGPVEAIQQSMSPVVLDALHKIQYFDGRCLHATKAFLGERYSLVSFFCFLFIPWSGQGT